MYAHAHAHTHTHTRTNTCTGMPIKAGGGEKKGFISQKDVVERFSGIL